MTVSTEVGISTRLLRTKVQTKISCRNVWKIFGANPAAFFRSHGGHPEPESLRGGNYIAAVSDVSLDVHRGEILVIMGLSGSGKSTLMRCLSRLIEPTGGEIFLDGDDLLQASPAEMIELRRHKMGMVFQHFALLPHRTVIQNIAFPLEVQGISREKRTVRAVEIIELVGLKGREDYYPRELSGGQQQRVGIARSLAINPDIWFLDEPFSALDPLIRREMQDEFLRLQGLLHKTIVFITHDFDEALRLADRIAIMNEGKIVQIGTAEELITKPATDYVAEFTREVPREKLLTVRSIMNPPQDKITTDVQVAATDKISTVAASILQRDEPVAVVDTDGSVIGSVSKQDVLQALFGNKP